MLKVEPLFTIIMQGKKRNCIRSTAVIFHGNKMCSHILQFNNPTNKHTHVNKQTNTHIGNANTILHTTAATTTTIVILPTNFTLQQFAWDLSVVPWDGGGGGGVVVMPQVF